LGDFDAAPAPGADTQGSDGGGWSRAGRNLHFGVREHAMGAIVNGLAAHGGFLPYGSTFLIFSDYMRPAIRLAALMGLHVIHVFTHDSIAVGEDGPTHQPVEQLAGLRRGAYVLVPPAPDSAANRQPALILIASGSEVSLILDAAERLQDEGIAVRCVSMPSWDLFDAQPRTYRDTVLPPAVSARLSVELGAVQGWHRYVGERGDVLGIERFGASAPAEVLLPEYGFTVKQVRRPRCAADPADPVCPEIRLNSSPMRCRLHQNPG
jgi:transketolase